MQFFFSNELKLRKIFYILNKCLQRIENVHVSCWNSFVIAFYIRILNKEDKEFISILKKTFLSWL